MLTKHFTVSLMAINEKTLQVTGKGLKNLKANSISLAGNEVVSVTPAAGGKSATITFKFNFTLDQEQTLKVEQEGKKEFKFTYSLSEIKSVELDAKAYDDDTKGQVLTFKVNGQSTTPDADFLRQAGYTVNFVAVNKATNTAGAIFAGTPAVATSATGLLADEIALGTYTIEIQIVKAGKVVVSDKKDISIVDIESAASAINKVTLTNNNGTTASTADDFVQNSTTLVAGESATISKLEGNAAGKTDVTLPLNVAQISSSNKAVVSVAGNVITANGPGSAVITVKIGNVSKDVTITVTNKARALTKITPAEGNVKLVLPTNPANVPTRQVNVLSVDQYGDPISVVAGAPAVATPNAVTEDYPKNAAGTNLITATDLTTNVQGKGVYNLQGAALGTGTLLFKDLAGKTLGQITVQVTNIDNTTSRVVEFAATSAVTSNTFAKGVVATYQLAKYSNTGSFNGVEALTEGAPNAGIPGYYVQSADTNIATVDVPASPGNTVFTVTGVKAGSTDITIKSETGFVVQKFTVTVTEASVAITKVNFKATSTIDYVGKNVNVSDALDVRADSIGGTPVDPIVYGIEHNGSTINKVRLASTGNLPTGINGVSPSLSNQVLYIDSSAAAGTAGSLDQTDTFLGLVSAEVLSGSTTATAGTPIAPITDISLNAGSYTTASKDKGVILFRVKANDSVTSTILSTTLDIDVK
jgi:hypothetical protein